MQASKRHDRIGFGLAVASLALAQLALHAQLELTSFACLLAGGVAWGILTHRKPSTLGWLAAFFCGTCAALTVLARVPPEHQARLLTSSVLWACMAGVWSVICVYLGRRLAP